MRAGPLHNRGTSLVEGRIRVEYLYNYLAEDFRAIDERLAEVHHGVEGRLMAEVAAYVGAGRGKLLRPAIVCLAARTLGYGDGPDEDFHIRLAAAVECFHVASLLHDDVIDKAPLRRGRETVNAKWGDDTAILFSDYLYASSFDLALSTLNPEALRVLTKTTQQMTKGEFLQIENRGAWLDVENYMEIIRCKTGYLFAASASLGAVIAGADRETIEKLGTFGLEFGTAFQITDDTLDYEAQMDRWGKRVGADLAEGKQTLPLLHTLQSADDMDREALLKELNNGRDFSTVQRYVQKYDAIDFSLDVASNHCRNAVAALEEFSPDNEAAGLLRQIAEGVLVRQF